MCLFGLFVGLFEGLEFGYDQAGRKRATSPNLNFDSSSDTDDAAGENEAQNEPLAPPPPPPRRAATATVSVAPSDDGDGKEGEGWRVVGHIDIHTPAAPEAPEATEAQEVDEEVPPPPQEDKDDKDYDPELDAIIEEAVNPRKRKRVRTKKTRTFKRAASGPLRRTLKLFLFEG